MYYINNIKHFYVDILKKVKRTTLNLWYEIKSVNERLERVENLLISKCLPEINEKDVFDNNEVFHSLPLTTEQQLIEFEKQFVEASFKNKMVNFYLILKLI